MSLIIGPSVFLYWCCLYCSHNCKAGQKEEQSFNCLLRSCRQTLRTVFPYKDNIEGVLFVDVSMMLYIMYFPVYRSKEDYNNFTSAHSWLLLTLGVWNFEWINLEAGLFCVSSPADSDSLAIKSKRTCKNESSTGHRLSQS